MVKREKETLIKIIELRKSQRDIILTLNRISIFPLQTEKQSTEVTGIKQKLYHSFRVVRIVTSQEKQIISNYIKRTMIHFLRIPLPL